MGPTPFYRARAEKPPFAKKQTNICRRSGDIKNNNDYKELREEREDLIYYHYHYH